MVFICLLFSSRYSVPLYLYFLSYFLLPPVFVSSTVHGLPCFFRLRLAGRFYVLGCFFYPDSTWPYAGLCSAVFISFGCSLVVGRWNHTKATTWTKILTLNLDSYSYSGSERSIYSNYLGSYKFRRKKLSTTSSQGEVDEKNGWTKKDG
jgi:hypothetical protein